MTLPSPVPALLSTPLPACVVWLTGLSGAEKSTLAATLTASLATAGAHSCILDGDKVRKGLSADLDFHPDARKENVRRVAEVARLIAESGAIAIVALVSPFHLDRQRAREIAIGAGVPFIEVFVNTPLDVCEQRDPKGLYKKARGGQLPGFTGIDAPYESPDNPDVILDAHLLRVEECIAQLMGRLANIAPVDSA